MTKIKSRPLLSKKDFHDWYDMVGGQPATTGAPKSFPVIAVLLSWIEKSPTKNKDGWVEEWVQEMEYVHLTDFAQKPLFSVS